jgi:hypothetical protein
MGFRGRRGYSSHDGGASHARFARVRVLVIAALALACLAVFVIREPCLAG